MEIRVILKTGIIIHTFNCPKEFKATIKRYQSDPAAKITVKP